MSDPTPSLARTNASWDRRAQVKRAGLLDVRFEPDLPDFLPELVPFAAHPGFVGASEGERMKLLTYGWLAFNQKAIDIEHNMLLPACSRLLEMADEAGDDMAVDAVAQSLVDESYHILMIRQANRRTLAERRLQAPKFPLCRTVQRMQAYQERFPAEWQRDLIVIGAAIVTEVFIKGYLGKLSHAEGVQPLCVLTTRAHLADESVHANIFLALAERLYARLERIEREFLADVLIRAMSWFSDPELPTWEVAIRAVWLERGEEMIRDQRLTAKVDIDYSDLATFLGRVGVGEIERRIIRVQESDASSPRAQLEDARGMFHPDAGGVSMSTLPTMPAGRAPHRITEEATVLDKYLQDNLELWDERVSTHMSTEFYGMDAFLKGKSSLTHIERDALGDVSGRRLLHLQCHFGQDTLSWAREGADVTGVDFSPKAIVAARSISERLGLPARFVQSDIYNLPAVLDDVFDIVFTSYGVLKWLPDIQRWGQVVARYLRSGGTFFMVEFHPFLYVFDYEQATRVTHPYFVGPEPISTDEAGTYADMGANSKTVRPAHAWPHPVSRVIGALLSAGLRLESFDEYPYSTLGCFPFVREEAPGRFVHASHPGMVPILYSVKATRP